MYRRPKAYASSNYSTATSASTARSEKPFSIDDFFSQQRDSHANHDQLKQARILQEFQEKQRLTNPAPSKNAVGVFVPETDVARLLRLNTAQVALLPEHLRPMALKILNEESEIRVQTDAVKEKCHTARNEIREDIQFFKNTLQKVYDAEKEYSEHITQIGYKKGVWDKNGEPIKEEPKAAPKPVVKEKEPEPTKTLAFGKIHKFFGGAK